MKKIIISSILLLTLTTHAEIKDLDLIFIDGATSGITGVLEHAYKTLSGEKNVTARLKVYKRDKKEKELQNYKKQSIAYKKKYEKSVKEFWNMRNKLTKDYWKMYKKINAEKKKLKIQNIKLIELLKIHRIDYEHANIKVDLEKKKKKMTMTITDK